MENILILVTIKMMNKKKFMKKMNLIINKTIQLKLLECNIMQKFSKLRKIPV